MKHINYELVNPFIDGTFKRIFTGDNTLAVAEKSYIQLASHFSGIVPELNFTLKNLENNNFFHFNVKEELKSPNNVNYIIKQLSNVSGAKETKFEDRLNKMRAAQGGRSSHRKHRRHSSSSSSSDDIKSSKIVYPYPYIDYQPYIRTDQQILYYYDPVIYQVPTFYVPNFVVPYTPIISINLI